jgi:hypothetical protein
MPNTETCARPPGASPDLCPAGTAKDVRERAGSKDPTRRGAANAGRRFLVRALAGVSGLLLLPACVTTTAPEPGPAPQEVLGLPAPEEGQGRIVFYRPHGSLFPALRPDVVVNGRKVGTSVTGDLFHRPARPGRYEIFLANDSDEPLMLTLAAGEVAYVRTSVAFGLTGPHLSPKVVEEDKARREITNLAQPTPSTGD